MIERISRLVAGGLIVNFGQHMATVCDYRGGFSAVATAMHRAPGEMDPAAIEAMISRAEAYLANNADEDRALAAIVEGEV